MNIRLKNIALFIARLLCALLDVLRMVTRGNRVRGGDKINMKSGMFKRLAIFIAKSMSSISCNEKCEQEEMVSR